MGIVTTLQTWYRNGNAVTAAKKALEDAQSFAEYEQAALLLDFLEGRNEYKAEPLSLDYDSALISARLHQLQEARTTQDFDKVLFLLRTTLSRNLGNMGNAILYARTHIGTKYLIDEYIHEVQLAFAFILQKVRETESTDTQEVLNVLLKTRQSFGRTALLFSGGGTLGMMHIGVVRTLFENKLLPRIISGSSAGAIVAAIVCTRKDEELAHLVDHFHDGNLQVFELNDTPETIFTRLGRFLKHGVFMDIGYLRDVMAEWMGNMTFGEAFNKTRRILNITVSSSSIYEMPRLLNYITSPNVIIWSAVAASCSIPGIFSGSPLLAKDTKTGEPKPWNAGGSKSIDGSIEGDLPTTRLSELFNVNHFIVSQVNPHVTPFLSTEAHEVGKTTGKVATMLMNELVHFSDLMTAVGVAPALSIRLSSILRQRYIGDITILPQSPVVEGFYKLLTNPTPEFMLEASRRGQRATWKRISLIRNHLQVEITIDESLYLLRLAVIQSTRPTRFLKSSQSISNFASHDEHRRRHRRRSSIVSNASVELEPGDLAPTRDPKMKSGQSTPRFDKSGFNWEWFTDTHSAVSPGRRGNVKSRNSKQPSRNTSVDNLTSHHSPAELNKGVNDYFDRLHLAPPPPPPSVPGLHSPAVERLDRYGYSRPHSPQLISQSRSPDRF